jgi:type IV secretory pathway TraG/TraD family ATPase VirD4
MIKYQRNIIFQAIQPSFKSSLNFKGFVNSFANPESLLMISGLLFSLVLSQMGRKKGKLSTGKMVGRAEKLAATNLALQQLRERQHHRVTVWCGSPQWWWKGNHLNGVIRGGLARVQTCLGASPTVWLPHVERGTLVLGAPGGGKTFGTIDRVIESFLHQGFPLLVYAKKEEEMQFVAPLAARYGYQVWVFAPGEPYSDIINPLDFMQDSEDQETAAQIAEVINGNAGLSSHRGDEFFSKAGNLLAKALIQLAKRSDCPDLATVASLQAVDQFVERLHQAVQSGRIPRWVAASFQQYLKAKESEKTIASIDTTTAGIFSGFIQKTLLPSFIGKSTIPPKLTGRQVIIFKLDDAKRDVVAPLLAAALHLTIVSNLSTPRKEPLGIIIDELPSLYLKALPWWINEYRSNGACFVLGVQSLKQLANAYGENLASAITSACSTKVLYNPANLETAKEFSEQYGHKEVLIKNRSMGTTPHQGRSTTWSESLQTMPILTPDQILRLPPGKCVITNPGYGSGGEASIPYLLKIPIPLEDIKRMEQSESLWESQVRPRLIGRSQKYEPEELDEAMALREQIAEQLLMEAKAEKL